MKKSLNRLITKAKAVVKYAIKKRPMVSFFAALGLLLASLVGVRLLTTPKAAVDAGGAQAKAVPTYQIGAAPTLTVHAQIEKTGVITLVSQTAGVVRNLKVSEGSQVNRNQVLVNLAGTYSGANAQVIQTQVAQANYTHLKDTEGAQRDLIAKRREQAEKTNQNADDQNTLSKDTLNRTKDQLTLNETILTTLSTNLQTLEETLPVDDALILAARQQKAQALSTVNTLKEAVASLEYTTNSDKAPIQLTDLGRDLALKSLDLEEKGLNLSLEIAGLSLKLAQVGESLYYPQAPFSGIVERVFVKPGQMVQPGTPLLTLTGSAQTLKAVALVSADVAKKVSRYEASTLHLPGGTVTQVPQYIATEPTDGNLYAITWCQLDQYAGKLSDADYISADLVLGYADSLGATPYVPLDAVYQTQDEAYVFVIKNDNGTGKVESRLVNLGPVFGSYVYVESGLTSGDQVILDRHVVTGDSVYAR